MLDIIMLSVLDDPHKEDEFELFIKKYERVMFSVAYGVLKNHHDAEDAVIDAMVGIAKRFTFVSGLDCSAKKVYACRCARNRAINILNSRSRRYESEIPVDELNEDVIYDGYLYAECENVERDAPL